MTNAEKLINLIKENPDLEVVPMVDSEVVADDCHSWWMGKLGHCRVDNIWLGEKHIHIKSLDDEEDVLSDMKCDGDIYELPDEEWDRLYASIPWRRVIIVWVTV